MCKETTKKREDWEENESVPVSWKVRTSAGSSGKEYILRPDGQQFMSRINALQHLIKEGYDEADLRAMKNKLCYEGWTTSEYLPSGWLCVVFGSNITAVEYMKESPDYTELDEARCKEFSKRRNQETQELRFEWQEGDHTLPRGWKIRKTGERENILSPEGVQYLSRVVSLTDMVKRGFRETDIEEMRSKLKYEGETTFNLP